MLCMVYIVTALELRYSQREVITRSYVHNGSSKAFNNRASLKNSFVLSVGPYLHIMIEMVPTFI